jgi:hypothetical protein
MEWPAAGPAAAGIVASRMGSTFWMANLERRAQENLVFADGVCARPARGGEFGWSFRTRNWLSANEERGGGYGRQDHLQLTTIRATERTPLTSNDSAKNIDSPWIIPNIWSFCYQIFFHLFLFSIKLQEVRLHSSTWRHLGINAEHGIKEGKIKDSGLETSLQSGSQQPRCFSLPASPASPVPMPLHHPYVWY